VIAIYDPKNQLKVSIRMLHLKCQCTLKKKIQASI